MVQALTKKKIVLLNKNNITTVFRESSGSVVRKINAKKGYTRYLRRRARRRKIKNDTVGDGFHSFVINPALQLNRIRRKKRPLRALPTDAGVRAIRLEVRYVFTSLIGTM